MRRRLLLGGTLGVVMLSVGLTASTFVGVNTPLVTSQPPLMSQPGRAAGVTHSTNTTTVVVAFAKAPSDPASAAIAATKQPAWDIAQATATNARALRSDAAAVTFDTSLTREQATQISKAAAIGAGVKYAEPSVTFYPTDAGGSGYYWNTDQINAAAAWANAPSKGKGVVVAVIDTGIADNPLLKKALLVDTIGGVTSGTTVSGTTWPGRPVTITYTTKDQPNPISVTTAPADAQGKWSIDLTPKPVDGTTLTASMTDSSGNQTKTEQIKVDSTVTELSVAPSNGSSFHGTVEPGSKVTLSTTGWSAAAVVDGGTWTLSSPNHIFTDGQVVTVKAVDKRGNVEIITVVIDQVSKLSVNSPSNGTITGTAEEGSTISVTLEGEELCSVNAGDDAPYSFSCTLDPVPAHGSELKVTATDPATNVADDEVTIDTEKPVVTVKPSNGTVLKGTVTDDGPALPITITATYPDGTTDTTTTTSGTDWSISDLPSLDDGDTVTITATDAAGNDGADSVTIDKVVPGAPQVNATDGTVVSGAGEAGATVTVTYKVIVGGTTRRPLTETHTVSDVITTEGTWTLTLDPVAGDNTWLTATVTDPSGNTSASANRQVHVAAPSAPTVAISDGTAVVLDGVEDDAVPSIVDSSDAGVSGTWADQSDGTWTFTPTTALTESDTVFVFVTDSDTTTSDKVAVSIDTTAPDAPVISDASTTQVNGTGEPQAAITATYRDSDGNEHTATVVSDNETWTLTLDPAADDEGTIQVTQTDLAGHVSPAATWTLVAPTPSESPDAAPAGTGADGVPADTSSDDAVASVGSGTVLPGYDFMDGDTDATDPGTVMSDPSNPSNYAVSSHGTHVAGIVAASGSSPLTGVAPGAEILPVRTIGANGGSMPDVVTGIYWAIGQPVEDKNLKWVTNPHPADVLNLSLGTEAPTDGTTSPCSPTLQAAIDAAVAKKIPVVVSAGNGSKATGWQGTSFENVSPANCSNVIVVTASTANRTRAYYSNWGTSATSGSWLVSAPGGGEESANCYQWFGSAEDATACTGFVVSTIEDKYQPMSGTSMAAPHVAGTAALLKSLNKSLRPADIANIIRSTATPVSGCATGICGSGILDAAAAVAKADDDSTIAPQSTYPAFAALPIAGTAAVGGTLTAQFQNGYPGITYQWYLDGSPISHATSSTYPVAASDYLHLIAVHATTTGGGPRAESAPIRIGTKAALAFTAKPWISGTRKVGRVLTAVASYAPSNASPKITYQWYRSGKKISKATKVTYKLTKKDRGKRITVKVTMSAYGYYGPISKTSSKTATVKR